MEIALHPLSAADAQALWQINEQGLPGVGKVSIEEMSALLTHCVRATGAYVDGELLGFVLCLLPGTAYGSPNYAWFNARYSEFLYVDRIAVAELARGRGVGSALYTHVASYADQEQWPVLAEVSQEPPNPGSMRFHARHDFTQVGTLRHPRQVVAMMRREPSRGGTA